MTSIADLFDEWVKEEEKKLSRKQVNKKEQAGAKRTYLHFDLRRPTSSLFSLKDEYLSQDRIASHGFWPFLKMTIKTPRIKNIKMGDTGKFKSRKRRKDSKDRKVYYASHGDALVYSWYSFLLNYYYENKLKEFGIEKCAVAYRKIPVLEGSEKNKSSINFAFEVFNFIKDKGKCAVVVSDITSFFDSLDHLVLKKEWAGVLGLENEQKLPKDHFAIYCNLTKFKYVDVEKAYKRMAIKFEKVVDKTDKHNIKIFKVPHGNGDKINKICKNKKDFVDNIVKTGLIQGNQNKNKLSGSMRIGETCGIMQGAPISATLANIYMLSFDKEINDYVKEIGGIYRRYSDDLVVVCGVDDFETVKELIQKRIKNYELEINSKKTFTTLFLPDHRGNIRGFDPSYLKTENSYKESSLYKNMQYLGFEYNGKNVFLRSSSLAKYYRKMKSKVRKSVSMAYGKRSKTKNQNNKIFKKALFKKYLHKGRRSFISYAYRAIDMGMEVLKTDAIKKQLSRRQEIMLNEIKKRTSIKRHSYVKNNQKQGDN